MFACCAQSDEAPTRTEVTRSTPSPQSIAVEAAFANPTKQVEVELPKTGEPLKQTVTLRRGSAQESWGLQLEIVAGSPFFLVTEVCEGAAQDFNKQAVSDAFQFQKYDCLVAVDGKSRANDMLAAWNSSSLGVDLTIERPRTITETLTKGEDPLGLSLKKTEIGMSLTVTNISDAGAAKKSEANVRIGDLILSVNGQMGTGKSLSELIMFSKAPQVTILRLESRS